LAFWAERLSASRFKADNSSSSFVLPACSLASPVFSFTALSAFSSAFSAAVLSAGAFAAIFGFSAGAVFAGGVFSFPAALSLSVFKNPSSGRFHVRSVLESPAAALLYNEA